MNTIQFLEAGSTELDPTLVNIWQSDQGSPRFISLHGITLRTALPGCACLLQAKPAAGTRDGWKTCGRIGETAGHPDGHPPQRALPDTFRWIGTAVDWESRDQNKALGRGVRIVGKPAHQPDGVDVRSVSLELFLNGRQVAWRAASTLVARPEELHSPQLAERRPDHGAPSSNSTGAGSREETPPTGPQGDVGADRRSAPSRLAPASRSERRCRPLQVNGRSASLLTPRVSGCSERNVVASHVPSLLRHYHSDQTVADIICECNSFAYRPSFKQEDARTHQRTTTTKVPILAFFLAYTDLRCARVRRDHHILLGQLVRRCDLRVRRPERHHPGRRRIPCARFRAEGAPLGYPARP